MRLWVLLLAAILCSGCFVFDEIDAGMELMEKHSPKASKSKQAQKAPEPASQKKGLRAWWDEQKALALERRARREEAAKPPPDPEDALVSCRVSGKIQFVRGKDCQNRGGTVVGRVRKPES